MEYIVETKMPDEDGWYPVIDMQKSKIVPVVKRFETEEQATAWAERNSVKGHEWRVIEHESE